MIALLMRLVRMLLDRPHVHRFRPDWLDVDDVRCRCGQREDEQPGASR